MRRYQDFNSEDHVDKQASVDTIHGTHKRESMRKEKKKKVMQAVKERKQSLASQSSSTPPSTRGMRPLVADQGEIRDPVIEKLLETINNENEQELEHVLMVEHNQLEKIRQTEIKGSSLLHYACSRNSVGVVDVLIRYAFDVNKKTSQEVDIYVETFDYVSKFRAGSTPLYIATVSGLASIVLVLLRSGANPNLTDVEGYVPLHSAAWHNKADIIRQLVTSGAKVNVQDNSGSTPLRKAAYRGHIDSVKLLLSCGADPNIKTKKGRAAIHCAALYGHTEILSLLLQQCALVNIQDNDDITPLHAAVYNGKRLAVRMLLKAGADVNMQTKFGNTPLHLACMEKWFVVVGLLVQAGAGYDVENRFGETPASILDTGNAGKRVNLFAKNQVPSVSELEALEADHRERQYNRQLSLKQATLNGQHQHNVSAHEFNPTSQPTDSREKRKK